MFGFPQHALAQSALPFAPLTPGNLSTDTSGVAEPVAALQEARALQAKLEQLAANGNPQPLLEEQRNLADRLVLLLAAESKPTLTVPLPTPPAVPSALNGPGPYRVSDVDTLRDLRESLLAQSQSLQYTLRGLDAQVDVLLAERRRDDETLRLKSDQIARARDEESRQRLLAEREVARLEARIGALETRRADRDRELARNRLASLTEQADAMGRTLERVRDSQLLDEVEVQAVAQAALDARRKLSQERRALERQLTTRQSAVDQSGGGTDASQRELQALRERLGLLTTLDLLEAGRESAWRQRQRVLQAVNGPDREDAASVLQRSLEQLSSRAKAADEQLGQARLALRLQRLRVEGLATSAQEIADERRAYQAMQALADTLELAQESFSGLVRLLSRTLEDAEATRDTEPQAWYERISQALQQAARAVWQYELFSLSDTTRVEGRDVTVDYGVTVGKSVGVLVLFLIGWFITVRLSRAGIGLLVRYAGLSEPLGKVLHRWLVSILLLGVLLLVLKLARIPLTVFAFLGGALAIGVGFGTQNIIKNLISGVIILFERKVRVGDIVTIDGVSGTVTSVDLRASTVRGFDGIDAIVPNSQLLEQRLSNWTYGSSTMRRLVQVGLSYGHDARHASAILLACAKSNPDVLADPPPEVLFNDFAADAQSLLLQFWVQLGGSRSGAAVDSDLRHAIMAAFDAQGLTIAFPQRDIHIDTAKPLSVRIEAGERQ